MKKKILIIDDEEDICVLLKNYLHKRNADVSFALTLGEGMKIANSMKPDLVFLDNNLPDGIGVDQIRNIKNIDNNIKVVMISAMNLKEKAFENGSDYFLEKPISFNAVKTVL